MTVTHFEIFGEEPERLAFYRRVLGWQIEKAPGIDYWRIQPPRQQPQGNSGVGRLAVVRFDPVFVNAQAGVTFRF